MSGLRPLLNCYLRWMERPHMARAEPRHLRRALEIKSRLFLHAPLGSRIWQKPVNGRPARWVSPARAAQGPLILYYHGGGYVFGAPRTHQAMLAQLAKRSGLPVCLPSYRLAPEHPFPAAFEDALAAYVALADHPGGVFLGGDSAGGGLALAVLAATLRRDLPRPLGVFAFSPFTDMTFSGDSLHDNARADVVLPAERMEELRTFYMEGADPSDPRVSPLFADFTDAPPVWLTAGDTEILLDDTRRMAARLRMQGVAVTELIEHDLPHVWPLFAPFLPEARATLDALAHWITIPHR